MQIQDKRPLNFNRTRDKKLVSRSIISALAALHIGGLSQSLNSVCGSREEFKMLTVHWKAPLQPKGFLKIVELVCVYKFTWWAVGLQRTFKLWCSWRVWMRHQGVHMPSCVEKEDGRYTLGHLALVGYAFSMPDNSYCKSSNYSATLIFKCHLVLAKSNSYSNNYIMYFN